MSTEYQAWGEWHNPIAANNLAAFLASERQNSFTDFNNDGDSTDDIVFIVDPASGVVQNTGVSGIVLALDPALVLIAVYEFGQGQTDLNNDGDLDDWILHRFDPVSGQTNELGLTAQRADEYCDPTGYFACEFFIPTLTTPSATFTMIKEADNGGDRNGDGDALDRVMIRIEKGTGDRHGPASILHPIPRAARRQ